MVIVLIYITFFCLFINVFSADEVYSLHFAQHAPDDNHINVANDVTPILINSTSQHRRLEAQEVSSHPIISNQCLDLINQLHAFPSLQSVKYAIVVITVRNPERYLLVESVRSLISGSSGEYGGPIVLKKIVIADDASRPAIRYPH
jgi:hypothetical protein